MPHAAPCTPPSHAALWRALPLLQVLDTLAELPQLEVLSLEGNPCCELPNYRCVRACVCACMCAFA